MLINADLGEGEPESRTRAMMQEIDLANIACGGHAGTPASMELAVRLALEHGVKIGAHPGVTGEFGRGAVAMTVRALRELLQDQVSRLRDVVNEQGGVLNHVKLHGALYHAVEAEPELAAAYLSVMREHFPNVAVIARRGGGVSQIDSDMPILREVFADRGYLPDGNLIARDQPGALLDSLAAVRAQVARFCSENLAETVCVHADTPGAVEMVKAVGEVLRGGA